MPQYRDRNLTFVQISDCHLMNSFSDRLRGIQPASNLKEILEHISHNSQEVDFFLVTGDISETASIESYQLFSSILRSYKKPYYCVLGNHDNEQNISTVLQNSNFKFQHFKISNWNLILMSTNFYGKEWGYIDEKVLYELELLLKEKREKNEFFLFATHHPPIKIKSEWIDKINLRNGKKILDLIQQYNCVKVSIFGHIHQCFEYLINQCTFLGTPATSYQFKPKQNDFCIDSANPGYRVVQLYANGQFKTKVIRLRQRLN